MSRKRLLFVAMILIFGGWLFNQWRQPTPSAQWLPISEMPDPPNVRVREHELVVLVTPCATITPESDYRAYIGYGDVVGGGSYIEGYKDLIAKIQTLRGRYSPRYYSGELTPIPPSEVTVVFEAAGPCQTPTPPPK